MNISLPETLKEYVRERVTEGGFSNPSDYVRALIREDKKRQAKERLEQMLLEGLESGESIEIDAEYWKNKREKLVRRAQERKSK